MISEAIEVDRNLDASGIIQNLFFILNYFWMPIWVDPSNGALSSFFQNCLAYKFSRQRALDQRCPNIQLGFAIFLFSDFFRSLQRFLIARFPQKII